uniref:Uncharacterized protein n=1 Tax=Anguilla anguilla TaxID=7936 RepID=A0A0E9SBK9_ANGAN
MTVTDNEQLEMALLIALTAIV